VTTRGRQWIRVLSFTALSCLLLLDATSNALFPYDARTGRKMGCYTAIELLVGVRRPSIIRGFELVGGLVSFVVAAMALVRPRRRASADPSGKRTDAHD